MKAIFIYSIETGKSHQVSDGRNETDWPVFDKNGKYLYFTSSASAGSANVFGMVAFPFRANVTRTVQAAVLQKDGRSPLLPVSGEEGRATAPRDIDVDGIATRT